MRAGEQLGEQLGQHALVLGLGVGVQQRHGHGFGPRAGDFSHELFGGVRLERALDALGAGALGRAEAQLVRHERRRGGAAQLVQARARLARELEHVGETLGGDQRGAGGAALQQRVGRDRHAMCEQLDVPGARAGALQHEAHGGEHCPGLLVGRRGYLGAEDGGVLADEHRVGESPADVDSE